MRVVAIDPGAKGGVACISSDGVKLTLPFLTDMPNLDTAKGLHDLMGLMHWADCGGKVVMEVQRGRGGNSVKGTWNHARHYGKLEACLSLVGASTCLVQPSVWMGKVKKLIGDPTVVGMEDTKARTWTLAKQLFPDVGMVGPRGRKKDGMADAICLGWYYLHHVHK